MVLYGEGRHIFPSFAWVVDALPRDADLGGPWAVLRRTRLLDGILINQVGMFSWSGNVPARSQGNSLPGDEAGKLPGHMNHNPSRRDFNSNSELEKPSANRTHLGLGAVAVSGLHLNLLHQHVGGGGQQDPELIGQEAAATRPVHREIVL